jgi:hypothetical protein
LNNKDKKDLYDRIVAKKNPFVFELKHELEPKLETEFFAFGNKSYFADEPKYIIQCKSDVVERYIKFKEIGKELEYTDKLEYLDKKNQLQIQYDSINTNLRHSLRNATVKLYDFIDGLKNEDVKSISEQIQLLSNYTRKYLYINRG